MKIGNKIRLGLIGNTLYYGSIPVIQIDEQDGTIFRVKLNSADIKSLCDLGINTDMQPKENFETIAIL